MTDLLVDTAARTLAGPFGAVACQIGRSGACPANRKHEGDGCTPLGCWPIRGALLRRGRFASPAGWGLPWRWIAPEDGWSDDPADPAYNRAVRHPHAFSAERLWREDALYDAVIVLGHNDRPAKPGAGSAIFLHLAGGSGSTEGCVAIEPAAMRRLLPLLTSGSLLNIR